MATSPVVLNLREASAFLRVSERTVGELAQRGELPARKVGREWRFLRTALEGWLAAPSAGHQFEIEGASEAPPKVEAGSTTEPRPIFRDTAFTINKDAALHRWVPWIAGFSAQFVVDVLDYAGVSGGTVLDPFAGVGTTLVEARKLGNSVIGFEINPYAALVCRSKLQAADISVPELQVFIADLLSFMEERIAQDVPAPTRHRPTHFKTRQAFFSPSIERQVLWLLEFIGEHGPSLIGDLAHAALGATMVGFSTYSYEPSLTTRRASGRADIVSADVAAIVCAKLADMASDIGGVQAKLAASPGQPAACLHQASCIVDGDLVAAGTVDCAITSPPYLNNYHYVRNTRPQLYWLGLVQDNNDLKPLETGSFGKFWQTVRSGPRLELEVAHEEAEALLEILRGLNVEKGPYGGPGWANYACTYFNDCTKLCRSLYRVMRPGGLVAVVLGNNIVQGVHIPTDRLFAGFAERVGFRVEDIHEVRKKRTGASIVNSSVRCDDGESRVTLYEAAVLLRRP